MSGFNSHESVCSIAKQKNISRAETCGLWQPNPHMTGAVSNTKSNMDGGNNSTKTA